MSLAQACSCRDPWLGPRHANISDLGLLPQHSAFTPSYLLPWRSLTQSWPLGGQWLKLDPSEVAPSYLLLWRSLTRACSDGGYCLGSALKRSLAWACSCGCPLLWSSSTEVPASTWSRRVVYLGPAPLGSHSLIPAQGY